MGASDPLGPIPHKLASCLRMLLANDEQREAALFGVQAPGQARVHSQDGTLRPPGPRAVSEARQVPVRSFRSVPRREDHVSTKSQANMSPMSPTDFDVALYLQREKSRLREEHHEFIDCMVHRLRPTEPTPK